MSFPERGAIDTNVLIVANARGTHVGPDCTARAVRFLVHAASSFTVLLDSKWQILNEYKNKCNDSGQPGVGDRFLLQVLRTQADSQRVHVVDITPTEDGSFLEVPASLTKFDRSDHKFIATVVSDGQGAPIVNSADSDWENDATLLNAAGINVYQLCEKIPPRKRRGANRK